MADTHLSPIRKAITNQALLQDLKRSGLSKADAEAMGLRFNEASSITGYDGLTSYSIPYFTLDGKRIPPTEFIRLRFLADPKALEQAGLKRGQRYWQLPGADNRFYLPPGNKMRSWRDVAQDSSVRIVILEGEKKAYASMLAGEYTIGLGGVNSWVRRAIEESVIKTEDGGFKPKDNKKKGRPQKEISEPLKDFAWFNWSRREVVIAFDWPDVRINRNVRRTLERFVAYLVKLGANCKVVEFGQDTTDDKTGADDYIVAKRAKILC